MYYDYLFKFIFPIVNKLNKIYEPQNTNLNFVILII